MLARLFYPVANPQFNYQFCKGFYARVAEGKMNGRVSRLLVSPLIRSMKRVFGAHPFLDYLDSFRYPLAGEFSMHIDVLRDLRIPADWGLEIGVLTEVYRNHSTNRVCQVEVADNYDHKHQELSLEDSNKGLSRMECGHYEIVVSNIGDSRFCLRARYCTQYQGLVFAHRSGFDGVLSRRCKNEWIAL